MAHRIALERALVAHSGWQVRLAQAVNSGRADLPLELIRRDDHCVFGQWLEGAAWSAEDKASTHYQNVRELHTQFHLTAAQIVALAAEGHKEEAEAMLGSNGAYARISAKLTQAMMRWKQAS